MHRFFVPPGWLGGGRARVEGPVARQISRVLRMTPGEEVVLLDGSGAEYLTRLERVAATTVEGEVVSVQNGTGEPHAQVLLYQALLKGDRFEWVLQKGTELGVAAFVPLLTLRAIPRKKGAWPDTHYARWRRIIAEAAEQAGRCVLPHLDPPLPFQEACRQSGDRGLSIIPWEGEGGRGLRAVLQGVTPRRISIFVGPEGGWAEEEVAYARSYGIVPVSLGRRILRAETAAIATTAAVMFALGELER